MKKINIEEIIENMLYKAFEINKEPTHLYLTQKHYDQLCDRLSKQANKDEAHYDVTEDNNIVYHETRHISLKEYKGIPVSVGAETRLKIQINSSDPSKGE